MVILGVVGVARESAEGTLACPSGRAGGGGGEGGEHGIPRQPLQGELDDPREVRWPRDRFHRVL